MRGPEARYLRIVVVALVAVAVWSWIPPLTPREASAISPRFGSNVLVDDASVPVGAPRLALAGDGVLHAVWIDRRTGTNGVYYSRSVDDGLTWRPSVRLDDGGAPAVVDVDVAAARSGPEVYVLYRDYRNGNADIYSSVSWDRGISWRPSVRVDDAPAPEISGRPHVAVDDSGDAYAVWEDRRNATAQYQLYFSRSTMRGAAWSPNVQVTEAPASDIPGVASIVTSGSGVVDIVWEQQDGVSTDIWSAASSDGGTTWSRNPVSTAGAGTALTNPDVASAPGRLYASWTNRTGTTQTISLSKSTSGGANWSPPVRVDDGAAVPGAYPDNSSVAIVADQPFVVWDDERNGNRDLFASGSSDDGASWGDCPGSCAPNNDPRVDDTGVAATVQERPSAAADGLNLSVVWLDGRSGTPDIYFSRYTVSWVRITEFADSPDGSGEAIELVNLAATPVDFAGYRLVVDGIPYDLGPLGVVGAGRYRVIGNRPGSDLLPPSFAGLDDEGGTLEVYSPLERTDSVSYGQRGIAPDPLPGMSTSRYVGAPGYTGVWGLDASPTLGGRNDGPGVAAVPQLILNEVFFNAPPGNEAQRYVEVYYPGSGSLNTTGFRLVGAVEFTIARGVVLSPANRLGVLPTMSGISGLLNTLRVAGDNLYLVDPGGVLLDQVGWSTDHGEGASVCRVPDGGGTSTGFDDPSTLAAGWQFGCTPGLRLIGMGPSQTMHINPGESVLYDLTAVNYQGEAAIVDLSWYTPPPGVTVSAISGDGVTPLPDTNLNGWPDLTLGPAGTPTDAVLFAIEVDVDITGGLQDVISTRISAFSEPIARASVDLDTVLNPYLGLERWADPTTVNIRGTGVGEETKITLRLTGRGVPVPGGVAKIADVVFVIDDTGSMGPWIDQAKADVDYITSRLTENVSDIRFGIVSYGDVPEIDVDLPLTADVGMFRTVLASLFAGGGADTPEDPDIALEIAANLSWRADPVSKIMVLVGDAEAHDNQHLVDVSRWAYNVRNIHTNTIGCGSDPAMILYFNRTAQAGNGSFILLGSPARMADAIIGGILGLVGEIDIAAQDADPADYDPFIRDVLPPHIEYVPGAFVDPATGAARNPSYAAVDAALNTVLEWNVTSVSVNATWAVEFRVTSSRAGLVPTNVHGLSRASFANWSGAPHTLLFPQANITVLGLLPITDLIVGQPKFVGAATYVRSTTPLSFLVEDRSGSGIRQTVYRVDGGPWTNYVSGAFTLATEGEHIVEWYSEDNTGNVEEARTAVVRVDNTPPRIEFEVGQPNHSAAHMFVTSATPLLASATDGGETSVGLASFEYRIDEGAWATHAGPFRVPGADGPREIEYRASDFLDNGAVMETAVFVDNTPPTTVISPATGPFRQGTRFTLTAADTASGVERTEYRLDGGAWIVGSGPIALTAGDHEIGYRSVDRLGNVEAERTLPVLISPPPQDNLKPLIAMIFALILVGSGAWAAHRAPWGGTSRRFQRAKAFLAASSPFIVAEGVTGVVSWLTGLLSIPPLLGIGTVVDVGILVTGVGVSIARVRRRDGQRPDLRRGAVRR